MTFPGRPVRPVRNPGATDVTWPGVYRGQVTQVDPIRVVVPQVTGKTAQSGTALDEVSLVDGDNVWVSFEAGAKESPVILGHIRQL